MSKWAIIRLIWLRELRDQFRDRRTLFMVVVLPVVLYPLLGLLVLQYALTFRDQPVTVGISGSAYLPAAKPTARGLSPLPVLSWLTMVPAPAPGGEIERATSAAALAAAAHRAEDFPPLLVPDGEDWRFSPFYFDTSRQASLLRVRLVDDDGKELLENRDIDVLLTAPADFAAKLEAGGRPELTLRMRDGDERSQQAGRRLRSALARWKRDLKEVRLERLGLPPSFDEPIAVHTFESGRAALEQEVRELEDSLIRIFPFMVVMWAMAGAMYPAVDICAGEKERGTLETLLISPAGRDEIACGKFLTIWLFSTFTTIWNLFGMSCTTWMLTRPLPHLVPSPVAFGWCVVSVLPLSALFSAICLAIGIYARSTKEGQYYLMPLFLLTLPLIFMSLAPDITLNPLTALIPVTGMAILMQKVMSASGPEQVPWAYFAPVLAMLAVYSGLALRWATWLFQREQVLFREAERLWDMSFLTHAWRKKG